MAAAASVVSSLSEFRQVPGDVLIEVAQFIQDRADVVNLCLTVGIGPSYTRNQSSHRLRRANTSMNMSRRFSTERWF